MHLSPCSLRKFDLNVGERRKKFSWVLEGGLVLAQDSWVPTRKVVLETLVKVQWFEVSGSQGDMETKEQVNRETGRQEDREIGR